jgi:tRNA threonylcarbamoyladenosine biosynthesis protein TsaB
LVAIDSLLVLAAAVENVAPGALLCPMIDARRMEVYCCLLDSSLQTLQRTHAKIIDNDSFMAELDSTYVLFFGNGAEKCKVVIRHPHAVFINSLHSTAASMGALAYQRFEDGQLENLPAFEPNYLKDFVAKTKSAVKLL